MKKKYFRYTEYLSLKSKWVRNVIVYNIYRTNSYLLKNYRRRIKLYDLYWTLDWLKFYHQIWCYGYRLCLSILKSVINMMLIECMSILSLSDMAQEKQTCIWCHQIFPSFWTIIQSGTFEHLGGCCFANVFCQPPLCWCQWARELRNMC